ncbi:D-arabinitol 2-dehydrogenase [ribulose-forming] [Lachnellula occidentalis]|uniref:D-arabinitol 2-dehydrogenase [ribulose-forming] n=1 Tax=Lachnellula occidentalis TaxID=215460 RepID=A0A8H8UE13_9HELO|nr:D-arabinitol 2-dehydrogenase [ribulose-forming] [Lachnellula occidentalis]
MNTLRTTLPRTTSRILRTTTHHPIAAFSTTLPRHQSGTRNPPSPPPAEAAALANTKANAPASTYLGTTKRLPEFNLVDKVVLVSGAGRGLGLVCAEALLEGGAIVYALDRLPTPSPDFSRVQKRASSELGTSLHYRRIDVRDVDSLNDIVASIADAHGRMDGLIAAAGIQQETPALEYTAADCDEMMSVNVTGAFMTCQAVARQMVRYGGEGRKGSIVMIGSMSGSVANKGLICPAYNASKAAVLQLARNLASEWGQYGIRVNTISPGYIVTAMVEALFVQFPDRREDWPKQNMLGRLSAPEEYRGAAVFLISDASSFMTGADLKMDGGHSAW